MLGQTECDTESETEFVTKLMKQVKNAMQVLGPDMPKDVRKTFKGFPGMKDPEPVVTHPCDSCTSCQNWAARAANPKEHQHRVKHAFHRAKLDDFYAWQKQRGLPPAYEISPYSAPPPNSYPYPQTPYYAQVETQKE